MPITFNQVNEKLRSSVSFKLVIIGFLILVLLIPGSMLKSLIYERSSRMEQATQEVSGKWAGPQTIAGPVLTVPYTVILKNDKGEKQTKTHLAHFLPEDLKITGILNPEMRSRGIYEIPLYQSDLKLAGIFRQPNLAQWNIAGKDMLWKDAYLDLRIPDMRGLQDSVKLMWNGVSTTFDSSLNNKEVFDSGVSKKIALADGKDLQYAFELDLKLKGSKQLYFLPVGKQTQVELTSSWPTPSFDGAFLPETKEISESGFRASWKILDLNRNYPQQWKGDEFSLNNLIANQEMEAESGFYDGHGKRFGSNQSEASAFGVKLFLPVDIYQKTLRSVKYMALFIFLTFLVFFLVELLQAKRIHPMQYLLVGFGMVLFYLLLLSFSEHIDFLKSYFIASVATVGLITLYSKSVFKENRLTAIMAMILVMLYSFLYILLQQEDYALLIGSICLFLTLAVVMFLTRKVNWYGGH